MIRIDSRYIVKFEFLAQSILRGHRPGACPYCRSTRQTLQARKYYFAKFVRCVDCGLGFMNPIYRSWLGDAFYDRLYNGEGSTTETPDADALRNLKMTNFAGSDKNYADILEKCRKVVAVQAPSILEFGSSWGYFLYQAVGARFEATGIEIADTRRRFGIEHLKVSIVRSIEEVPPERQFNIVFTAHVLEHLTDISALFKQFLERLKPDGHLLIEVPNADLHCPGGVGLKGVGAVHPIGFDSEFFRTVLPRNGFRVSGIYSGWTDYPERPSDSSSAAAIVVHARPRQTE